MRSKVRRAGPKPAIAFTNREVALTNIKKKCAVLQVIVKAASAEGPKTLERENTLSALVASLPNSRRQFNAWSTAASPAELAAKYGEFSSNANATLNSSGELQRVLDALATVRILQGRPKPEERQAKTRARLQEQVGLANRLRIIAEREMVGLMLALSKAGVEVETLKRQLEVLTRESRNAAEEAARRIEMLEARLECTSGPNVVRLRVGSKEGPGSKR